MEMKPFSKTDWYGFSGAEEFENGDAPLIGETIIPDWPEAEKEICVVIIDKNGFQIFGIEMQGFLSLDLAMNSFLAAKVAALFDGKTFTELLQFGFKPVGFKEEI